MTFSLISKHITLAKMVRISGEGNIHSNEDVAKQKGLGGVIVQGGQLCGYLNEMMIKAFGAGYVSGGGISVSFIKRVLPDETVTTHGEITGSSVEGGVERVECDIWLENKAGEKVVVGTAKAMRPAGSGAV